jgi:hypothetical protein
MTSFQGRNPGRNGSQDEHEEGESSMARVADKVPLAGQTKSVTSTDIGSPRESEAEDSSVF